MLEVVIRDCLGNVVVACYRKSSNVPSSFATETIAVIHAVELAVDFEVSKAISEDYAFSIIKKLQSTKHDLSEINALIWETNSSLGIFHLASFGGRRGCVSL
ncbi:hypothetical protein V6N13_079911 [Hibiscus sabdariffa]|uniref:RNase H type-1 domain-containing protein n=1 Tax=Hibiscus sabdariffa TaxID=183260 RepID=A0ABR2RTF1_9ROSI